MKKNFYIFSSGTLRRKDNTVCFEKEGGKKHYLPVEKIESITTFGELNYNTRFTQMLYEKQISLHIYNHYGWYIGSFIPRNRRISGKLLTNQVMTYLNRKKRLNIARSIIESATYNMNRIIQRNSGKVANYEKKYNNLKTARKALYEAKTINEVMAHEGNFRQYYYKLLAEICKVDFKGRKTQPPIGKLNCLISFLNTLTYSTTLNKILQTHLYPEISYLHEPSELRYSLSLDLSELFKPIIVDRIIINLLRNNGITDDDFDKELKSTLLNENGRKKVINEYEKYIATTVYNPKMKKKTSYQTLIKLECYKLIRHLLTEEKYLPFKMWW